MKKYQELQQKYKSEIEAIKKQQEVVDQKLKALQSYEETTKDEDYQYFVKQGELAEDWGNAELDLNGMMAELSEDIEGEYWDVPFAKSRNEGIDKFWELTGLNV